LDFADPDILAKSLVAMRAGNNAAKATDAPTPVKPHLCAATGVATNNTANCASRADTPATCISRDIESTLTFSNQIMQMA
jgi:hypothetical protein